MLDYVETKLLTVICLSESAHNEVTWQRSLALTVEWIRAQLEPHSPLSLHRVNYSASPAIHLHRPFPVLQVPRLDLDATLIVNLFSHVISILLKF
jgi:hypothetical protein